MSSELEVFTKGIADALREKEGTTELISPRDFGSRIRAIEGKENLDAELKAQEDMLADLEEQVNDLDEVSGELEINENGQYNVKKYESVSVNVGGGSTRELILELPEEFTSFSTIYTFLFDEDTVLISASGKGLWEYKVSTNSYKQLYSINSWDTFIKVEHTCLISSTQSSSSYKGLLVYNSKDGTVEKKYSKGNRWTGIKYIGNKYFIHNAYNSEGVLLYDLETTSITNIIYNGYPFKYYTLVGNRVLITGGAYAYGVYSFNIDDNTIKQVYSQNVNWMTVLGFENKALISNSSSGYKGIIRYDLETDSAELLYSEGYNWSSYGTINDKILLGGNGTGVVVYNTTEDTITPTYTSNIGWKNFIVLGNKCFISTSSSSTAGLLMYDDLTGSTVLKHSSGYNWVYGYDFNNKYFITGNGVLVYDIETDTISSKFSAGSYDTFTPDGNNLYIEREAKTSNPRILYYNAENDNIKIVKYYVGEI